MVQTGQALVVPNVVKDRLHYANAVAIELPASGRVSGLALALTGLGIVFGIGAKGHLAGTPIIAIHGALDAWSLSVQVLESTASAQ